MTASDRVQEMPADVRTARRLLWVQVTVTAAMIGLVLAGELFFPVRLITEEVEDPGWSSAALYFRIGYVLLLGTLAANLVTRLRWVRNLTTVAELLYVADWGSSLVVGYPDFWGRDDMLSEQDAYEMLMTGVSILTWTGMILAVVVIAQLYGGGARSWFDRGGK